MTSPTYGGGDLPKGEVSQSISLFSKMQMGERGRKQNSQKMDDNISFMDGPL